MDPNSLGLVASLLQVGKYYLLWVLKSVNTDIGYEKVLFDLKSL